MRQEKYKVQIPDIDYWKRQIKCQDACPVHTDSRAYVCAIAAGDYEKAYLIARGPNPLASICGRICGAPCEAACRREDFDGAVSIRALKRFVSEKFGMESEQYDKHPLGLIDRLGARQHDDCRDFEDISHLLKGFKRPVISADAPTVGICGSGPAGLAAAHDLCLMGIKPIIYEMEPVLGGMLTVGIPEYRLPRDLIRAELEVILSLGAEAVNNCLVGRDVSFPELRKRHDAVVVAVGAKRSRASLIPGSDAQGVFGGVEFLREVSLENAPRLGPRVVVIGGGDAAMDSARTALRVGTEDEEGDQWEEYLAIDAARSAMRLKGREINILYRRSREEMPANQAEIREAQEEGIQFHLLTAPVSIEKNESGAVRGVWCQKMKLGATDASGRKRPIPVEGSDYFLACDNVILAVGQSFDLSFIGAGCEDLQMTDPEHITCDPMTGATSAADVFVAGDLAHGPRLMIDAIASGKRAARKIYAHLKKKIVAPRTIDSHETINQYHREWGYESLPRESVPALPPEERKKSPSLVVETGFSETQGLRQAHRCLNCAVNTIFDSRKCILCGGCADVCPQHCLKLVSFDRLQGNEAVDLLIQARVEDPSSVGGGAIIKDESICIRCGLCAQRCPVGAITMETFNFKEEWIYEG